VQEIYTDIAKKCHEEQYPNPNILIAALEKLNDKNLLRVFAGYRNDDVSTAAKERLSNL